MLALPERRFGAADVLSQREVALPESELSAVSLATLAQLHAVRPLRAFPAGPTLTVGVNVTPPEWRQPMTWKTPKIVEVPVGMEINMYACAARK